MEVKKLYQQTKRKYGICTHKLYKQYMLESNVESNVESSIKLNNNDNDMFVYITQLQYTYAYKDMHDAIVTIYDGKHHSYKIPNIGTGTMFQKVVDKIHCSHHADEIKSWLQSFIHGNKHDKVVFYKDPFYDTDSD